MRPGLTLLCITKDQAPKLMRMLQSMQGVVDEMVVVDTGSKDLSPGVARMQGARVLQIEWPGSFSEALNVGMSEVRTEWTLRLDTDEWIVPEEGPKIRRLMDEKGAFGFYLIRQDLTDDEHFSESWHLRMWRSHSALRFEGYIHEYFPDEILEKAAGHRKVFRAPVRFLHDGFLDGIPEAKHRRNIELLKREIEARPGQLYYEAELAMTLILLREPGGEEMAARLAKKLVEEQGSERPEPFTASILGTALRHSHGEDLNSETVQRIIDRAWEWFDASPPMLWSIAQTELRRKNPEGVLRALLRLEELGESGEYEREWTFDSRILHEGLWEFLSRIAAELGREDIAARNRARIERFLAQRR
ncbi:MAG TPA: glycosyltransferase [Fimbriimonadaceae bacterium]|nr:glycosyltransferase [Fimbriimonadaceae bacterium]